MYIKISRTFSAVMTTAEELKVLIDQHVALEEGAWEELHKSLTLKQVKRKEHFLRQGEVARYIGLVTKGYARLYYLQDGKEITKDFNFENFFCGSYASFSLQQPSRFNVVAMEDLTLILLHRDIFNLFDKYPGLQKFGRLMMERMFIRKELRESSFLLDSAEERYEELRTQFPGIELRVPQKYLASYLGITPETLSRIRGL